MLFGDLAGDGLDLQGAHVVGGRIDHVAGERAGVRDLAEMVLDRQVRLGRPKAIRGLPESLSHHLVASVSKRTRNVIAYAHLIDGINAQNGCHFFTASRPDRDPARYRVDFSGRAFLDYAPSLRFRCEIMSQPSTDEALAHLDAQAREAYCRNLFQSLWQLDLVTLGR